MPWRLSTFGMDLALLMTKPGELPGKKTVLYPPKSEIARIGLSLMSCVVLASAIATAGFSARCGLLIFKKCNEDESDPEVEDELMRKGS
jgi:hypothetical protein